MNIKIAATGHYLPKKTVSNQEFEQYIDTNDEWIRKRTGIESRHFEAEGTSHMAAEAALKAIEQWDQSKEDIDMVIVATVSPDSFTPNCANDVIKRLDIPGNIPSFDVNAACSGFIYCITIARSFILSGLYKNILVIGADMNSRYVDFEDRTTAVLFGDAAGAIILSSSDKPGIIDSMIFGEIDATDCLGIYNDPDSTSPFVSRPEKRPAYIRMIGQTVFKFAVRAMTESVTKIVEKNGLKLDEIDYIIPHQANARIIDASSRQLGLSEDKFLCNLQSCGNTSNASIGAVLDQVNRDGILKPGMKIVMVVFGGGLTYGSVLIEW